MKLSGNKSLICFIVLLGVLSLAASKDVSKKSKSDQSQQEEAEEQDDKSPLAVIPTQQIENADKIHSELKQIISRTQELQKQIRTDRSEINEIMERAQIHQKILKGITIPKPIQSKQQINRDDIIAREKMRLIALQAHQSREYLKAFQSSRLVPELPKTDSRAS